MAHDWTWLIGRASGALFLSGLCVLLAARWRSPASPRWHRLAWSLVLLQGLILFPFSLNISCPAGWMPRRDHGGAPHSVPSWTGSRQRADRAVDQPTIPSKDPRDASGADGPVTLRQPNVAGERPPAFTEPVETDVHDDVPAELEGIDDTARPIAREHFADEGTAATGSPGAPATGPLTAARGAPLPRAPSWPIGELLIAGWLGGLGVVLLVLTINYLRLAAALRWCRPARPRWTTEFQSLCVELRVRGRVTLDVHPVLGPCLAWTPRGYRVVVPVRLWNRLSESERSAVLHHELSHLRRGDLWKSLLARLVVALHWFNPVAWLAARRFDETAEWECDALLAREAPTRAPGLATAILTAAGSCDTRPLPALAATGGPLFQRVHRLLTGNASGDPPMHKFLWTLLLAAVALCGAVRLEIIESPRLQAADSDAGATVEVAGEGGSVASLETPAALRDELKEFAERIVVNDSELLKNFVAFVTSPTGWIVLADRGAVRAQAAAEEGDLSTHWEQFVAKHFERQGDHWSVRPAARESLADYLKQVERADEDLRAIAPVLQEVAAGLTDDSNLAPMLRRFLQHEAAGAILYEQELRNRLHPGADSVAERLGQQLVRTQSGRYVIRLGRRSQVERRLEFVSQLQPTLDRFQRELAAWGGELVDIDEQHQQFARTLADPSYAGYSVFQLIGEEVRPTDEALDGAFWRLEEATDDTPAGLKLKPDNEQFEELRQDIGRFAVITQYREQLRAPLLELAELLEPRDALHERFKGFLQSDLALMFLARESDYLPVPAEQAAREFLASIVTRNEAGQYEITIESPEELQNRIDEFFRESREIRRRGRVIDEFAQGLADEPTRAAFTSVVGKLLLRPLIAASVERPQIDGVQLWLSDLFEETPEGLVLRDGASDAIEEALQEQVELEKQLSISDF